MQALASSQKVCNENERNKQARKKRRAHKNVFDGRKHFIRQIHKS